ncbi:hypothetical protein KM918_08860 [Priestia megaterium]|uniref:hypothetical protein n=1 Tax=Priestia megaterium TaxID=1404 RepID=UPI001C21019C|nr:hypothetical protein [Priestia megaterium]MBU8687445.1 hypothetical protein [Priestia megaterium]
MSRRIHSVECRIVVEYIYIDVEALPGLKNVILAKLLDLSVCRSPCGVSVIRIGGPLREYSVKKKSRSLMKDDCDWTK